MAHLLAPKKPDPTLPVFFNVDGVVGAAPAQNKREDVLLVQFGFKILADSPRPGTPPALLAAARAVRVTGVSDAPTVTAIRSLQQSLKEGAAGTVVDGRVSPARSDYSYGAGLWSIVQLNEFIQGRNVDLWPRIDKVPGCPDELKQMVIRTVAGT